MARLTGWSLDTAADASRAGGRPTALAPRGLRLLTLTILVLAATLGLAFNASAFKEPAKGHGTLANFDSRNGKSANAAASTKRVSTSSRRWAAGRRDLRSASPPEHAGSPVPTGS